MGETRRFPIDIPKTVGLFIDKPIVAPPNWESRRCPREDACCVTLGDPSRRGSGSCVRQSARPGLVNSQELGINLYNGDEGPYFPVSLTRRRSININREIPRIALVNWVI